jgi:hypothetical protein
MSGSLIRVVDGPTPCICPVVHIHKMVAAAAPLEAESRRKARIIRNSRARGENRSWTETENTRRAHGHLGTRPWSCCNAQLFYSNQCIAKEKIDLTVVAATAGPALRPERWSAGSTGSSPTPQKKCSTFPCNEPWSRPIMGFQR